MSQIILWQKCLTASNPSGFLSLNLFLGKPAKKVNVSWDSLSTLTDTRACSSFVSVQSVKRGFWKRKPHHVLITWRIAVTPRSSDSHCNNILMPSCWYCICDQFVAYVNILLKAIHANCSSRTNELLLWSLSKVLPFTYEALLLIDIDRHILYLNATCSLKAES